MHAPYRVEEARADMSGRSAAVPGVRTAPIAKSSSWGLPGAGKTTLARALAPLLNAVVHSAKPTRGN